ncbi:MAG TPA: tetratricopeptide repeat protein [Thermoanaerobaculia bacterium]|nr:tetratricopeptide repeat protein [Thermoanaerobaculia bacterium]
MRLTGVLLPLLLVLAPAAAPAEWVSTSGPGFELVTDLPAARASWLADQLHRLRALLDELGPEGAERGERTRVFVLGDRDLYLQLAPRPDGQPDEKVSGFFQTSIFGDRLVVDASRESDTLETLFHEALHAWMRRHLPWAPLWLNEGLAEYYSTARIEGERAVLGTVKTRHLEWLDREPWMPLGDVVAVPSTSELYHEGDRRGAFYAESWALVHYLLAEPRRRAGLRGYLDDLESGADLAEAFEGAFETTYLGLEGELVRYLAPRTVPTVAVAVPGRAAPVAPPRRLSRLELALRLGELSARLGHLGEARARFEEALALDPRSGLARAGLGEVHDLAGDHGTAEIWYQEAAALAPDHPLPLYLLGEAMLRRLLRQQRDAGSWTELDQRDLELARDSLRRSLRLDADRGATHAALGQSWLVGGPGPPAWGLTAEGVAEALAALGRAAELLPGEPQVLVHLGLVLCRSGDCERPRRTLTPLLRRFRRPELLELQAEQLATTELELAGWLVNHGDTDQGQAIAERLEARLEPALHGRWAAAIDEIVRVARHNRGVREVERALELARDGRTRDAVALLEALLAERPGPEIERAARDLRRRLALP